MPIIRSPSNFRCSLWFPYECGSVLSRGRFVSLTNGPRLRTFPPPHSYGNQRLQRQFDGLLMMGIVIPETCWAVSVWQSNKILRLIVASSWVFYLNVSRYSQWVITNSSLLGHDITSLGNCYVKFLRNAHTSCSSDDFFMSSLWFKMKPICCFRKQGTILPTDKI